MFCWSFGQTTASVSVAACQLPAAVVRSGSRRRPGWQRLPGPVRLFGQPAAADDSATAAAAAAAVAAAASPAATAATAPATAAPSRRPIQLVEHFRLILFRIFGILLLKNHNKNIQKKKNIISFSCWLERSIDSYHSYHVNVNYIRVCISRRTLTPRRIL